MIRPQNFGTLLALGALTVLPACSMFGGGQGSGASSYQQSRATTSSRASSGSQTAENTMPPVVSPSMLRKVQGNLKQEGLYRGRVDGTWGPMTEHAVMSYQQQHNLNTTGKLDLPTLQAMNETGGNEQFGETNGSDGNAGGSGMSANAGANGGNGNMNAGMNGGSGAGSNGTQTGANYSTGPQTMPGRANAANVPPNQAGQNGSMTGNAPPPAGQGTGNQPATGGTAPTH